MVSEMKCPVPENLGGRDTEEITFSYDKHIYRFMYICEFFCNLSVYKNNLSGNMYTTL